MLQLPEHRQSSAADEGWLSRERAKALALVVATSVAVYLCYLLAATFLPALAWGLALAIIAAPMHRRIERLIGRPSIAAGASVFIVAVVLVAPALFVTQRLAIEAISYVQSVKEYAADERWEELLAAHPRLATAAEWLEAKVDVSGEVESAAKNLAAKLPGYVGGSLSALALLLITLLVLFYFLRDRRQVLQTLRNFLPLSNQETDRLFARVDDTVYATVFGSLTVAAVQGVMGGLIFWLLGLPTPLLWGSIMALLAVVPMLGTFVVWLPTAVVLGLQGSWGKALVLVAWGSIAIALIDNLLYPILVGKRLRMHPLIVFIALVGGLGLFGAAGVVIGPVIVAVTQAIVQVWRDRTAEGGTLEEGAE